MSPEFTLASSHPGHHYRLSLLTSATGPRATCYRGPYQRLGSINCECFLEALKLGFLRPKRTPDAPLSTTSFLEWKRQIPRYWILRPNGGFVFVPGGTEVIRQTYFSHQLSQSRRFSLIRHRARSFCSNLGSERSPADRETHLLT